METIHVSNLKDNPIGATCAVLAAALFGNDPLSLTRGARLPGMSVGEFASHLSWLGIPVIALDGQETMRDMDTLDNGRPRPERRQRNNVISRQPYHP